MFKGILTALITPFSGGKIDYKALSRLIENQLDAGVSGFIVSGTTGEAPTLSGDEKMALFGFVVENVKGRGVVIAGTGSNNTAATVEFSEEVGGMGVDGLLIVVPYYNKPTQEGLFRHFNAVAEAVSPLPIVVYNVPGRTVADCLPETIARLSETANITHVKEATGDMERVDRILELAPNIGVLSGDDKTFFRGLQHGMNGIISVASNIFPRPMVEIYSRYIRGDEEGARGIDETLRPLYEILFRETNPIPVKSAAAYLGYIEPDLRLPLVPLSEEYRPQLMAVVDTLQRKLNP
jgi:4-hydroxy-tetrahydrodipicolinate synthase